MKICQYCQSPTISEDECPWCRLVRLAWQHDPEGVTKFTDELSWISVDDKLPAIDAYVEILFPSYGHLSTAHASRSNWPGHEVWDAPDLTCGHEWLDHTVTHWRPLVAHSLCLQDSVAKKILRRIEEHRAQDDATCDEDCWCLDLENRIRKDHLR